MTDTDDCAATPAWWRRALTLALAFAYAPSMAAAPFVTKDVLRRIGARHEFFALGAYTLASFIAVTAAFIALAVGPKHSKTQKRLFVFLLAYWFPHTLAVLCWAFVGSVGHTGAWIDEGRNQSGNGTRHFGVCCCY